MTVRTHTLEATMRTIPDVEGIAARTVVALPPSDLDPADDEMRVYIGGVLTIRAYDPNLDPAVVPPGGYLGGYGGGYA